MRDRLKRRGFYLAACYLAAAALAVFSYPYLSDWLCRYAADREIAAYEAAVAVEDQETLSEVQERADEYNRLLSGSFQTDQKVLSRETGGVSLADYSDLLAVTDAIGYLEIPKLKVYLPIYHGVEKEVLDRGIGHLPDTSLPVGGESTHCVLSGHTGLPSARLLSGLDQMKEGDRFYIHVLDQVLAYEVDQISVVLPEETRALRIEKGKDYVTLLTCTPYGVNSHRLLVRGERTEYQVPEVEKGPAAVTAAVIPGGPEPKTLLCLAGALGGVLILILSGLILFLPDRRKGEKKE